MSYFVGGRLIEILNREDGGRNEVKRIIREELRRFMYNDGDGQELSKIDFFKWKNKIEAQKKVIPIGETYYVYIYLRDTYRMHIPISVTSYIHIPICIYYINTRVVNPPIHVCSA